MPKASPIPRKYITTIEDAKDDLRFIAHQARTVIEGIEANKLTSQQIHSLLQEIEAKAYKVALELAAIEIAENCDTCPAAPPTTRAQAHLLVLANLLVREAGLARQAATEDAGRNV